MLLLVFSLFCICSGFLPSSKYIYSKKYTHLPSNMLSESMQEEIDNYASHWYVIGESKKIISNKLYKTKIWDEDFVFWKNKGQFYAMDDDCSHRGASLSGGKLIENKVICPYHAYEFDCQGTLIKVPGLNFTNTPCKNQKNYAVLEKNGWVYLNTKMNPLDLLRFPPLTKFIYEEPESHDENFSCVLFNKVFRAYGRVVSENSLDVMHIAYVHTFGNKNNPSPIRETPPYKMKDYPNHYKTEYDYLSGEDSIAKRVYFAKTLQIENEFVIPHLTVARVIFDDKISTIITFATPHNQTHSTLYVKTYRNFWYEKDCSLYSVIYNFLGDFATKKLMENTVEQDRAVVEGIYFDKKDGKFNMKYDKLQSVYKQKYKKFVEEQKNDTNSII